VALILVVDDVAGARALLRAVLTRAGHEVLAAADGCEALATATTRSPRRSGPSPTSPSRSAWRRSWR
jgi:CheY-like chemotaxis protein